MIRLLFEPQTYSLVPIVCLDEKQRIIWASDRRIPCFQVRGIAYALMEGGQCIDGKNKAPQWGLMSLMQGSPDHEKLFTELPSRLRESDIATCFIPAQKNPKILFNLSDYMKLNSALIRLNFQLGSAYYWSMLEKV